jgi:flagellar hook-associated protein FlgK
VEIKLVDRVKALSQLAALLQSNPEASASSQVERFYQALEEGAQVMGHD